MFEAQTILNNFYMEIPEIKIEEELRRKLPGLILGNMVCEVKNTEYDARLWGEILQEVARIEASFKIADVKHIPAIEATRQAYKICGKDPNRYRPSAEQLHRRILQGKALYQISTLVDLINLVSLRTAYSIGGFDLEKVNGSLSYGIGGPGEKYVGIGRGELNVEGMPILRDKLGGIGTPTSDEVRTMISTHTKKVLLNINCFEGNLKNLKDVMDLFSVLLERYASVSILKLMVNH